MCAKYLTIMIIIRGTIIVISSINIIIIICGTLYVVQILRSAYYQHHNTKIVRSKNIQHKLKPEQPIININTKIVRSKDIQHKLKPEELYVGDNILCGLNILRPYHI